LRDLRAERARLARAFTQLAQEVHGARSLEGSAAAVVNGRPEEEN
jgi:hypothetical protein